MDKKDILVWTNPLTYIMGTPLVLGIFLGVSVKTSLKETASIVKGL